MAKPKRRNIWNGVLETGVVKYGKSSSLDYYLQFYGEQVGAMDEVSGVGVTTYHFRGCTLVYKIANHKRTYTKQEKFILTSDQKKTLVRAMEELDDASALPLEWAQPSKVSFVKD